MQFSVIFDWLVFSDFLNDNTLRWIPKNLTGDKSTLVQAIVEPNLCRHMASLGNNELIVSHQSASF